MSPPEDREIPISLRGIETILRVLDNTLKEPSSIRQISVETDLSLRVTKNILLELENLKLVEQIVEEGQVLAKWVLTNLGKKNAKAIEAPVQNGHGDPTKKLMDNLVIPKKIEVLTAQISSSHKAILTYFSQLQLDLSKAMGICFSVDQPAMAENLGQLIQKIKTIQNLIDTFRVNPLVYFSMKKKSSADQLSSKQKRALLIEILLLNQVMYNQISHTSSIASQMTTYMEQREAIKNKGFSFFIQLLREIGEELRIFTHMVQKRTVLEANHHILDEGSLLDLQKRPVTRTIVEKYLPEALPDNTKQEIIQNQLKLLISDILNRTHSTQNCMPLISLYALFSEQSPYMGIRISDLEEALEALAIQKLIVGIKTIKNGGEETYRVVQFTTQDLMVEEINLLRFALEKKSFSKSEIMQELEWDQKKTDNILTILTSNGLLRNSKSYLHGEIWYIVA